MKVKWKMEQEDSVGLGITYNEVGKIKHDLGTSIICEADIDEPNILRIKNELGEWKPECYSYTVKDGLEVYGWEKLNE